MRFDETRRRMEREARVPTEYRPLFSATLPLFLYSTVFFIHARPSIRHACSRGETIRRCDSNREEMPDSTFHLVERMEKKNWRITQLVLLVGWK